MKPFNKELSRKRIENILNLKIDTESKPRIIPMDEMYYSYPVSRVFATIMCICFNFSLENKESEFKMLRLIASEYYNALINHPKLSNIQFLDNKFLCIYDTPLKEDIDEVIEVAATVNMLYGHFRKLLPKEKQSSFLTSIGINYAPVLSSIMGSSDSDDKKVMYQGKNIKKTIEMAEQSNGIENVIVTPMVQSNIKKEYQKFFKSENDGNYVSSVAYQFDY